MSQITQKKSLAKRIYENRWTYVFLLPGILFLIIFSYVPMYGIMLAFKDFHIREGIMGSPFSDPIMKNFIMMTKDPKFWDAVKNTLQIGFMFIITGFPMPIILAILLNELRFTKFKKVLQTIFTFPNFLSWVVVGGMFISLFSSTGFVNIIIRSFGGETVDFLVKENMVRPMLYISAIWKSAGWSSILYMAAIAGISPELYEAADMDGANRFHKILYITWPGIKPTAVILLILAFGGIMGGGIDQILNMVNPVVKDVAETVDTFIYRRTFQSTPNYGFSTAVGLSKSVINVIFLLTANKLAKLMGEKGVM